MPRRNQIPQPVQNADEIRMAILGFFRCQFSHVASGGQGFSHAVSAVTPK
jgi:hypothetical protein